MTLLAFNLTIKIGVLWWVDDFILLTNKFLFSAGYGFRVLLRGIPGLIDNTSSLRVVKQDDEDNHTGMHIRRFASV
jgi:hypothetical protein